MATTDLSQYFPTTSAAQKKAQEDAYWYAKTRADQAGELAQLQGNVAAPQPNWTVGGLNSIRGTMQSGLPVGVPAANKSPQLSGWAKYNAQPTGNFSQPSMSSGGRRGYSSGGSSYSNYPTMAMPTLNPTAYPTLKAPTLPTYAAPERDKGRMRALQQKAAGPGIGNLRTGLERAQISARNEDNPAMRHYLSQASMSGYGEGLGEVTSRADIIGMNEYEKEYAPLLDESKTNFGVASTNAMNQANIENQMALGKYSADQQAELARYNMLARIYGRQGTGSQISGASGSTGSLSPIEQAKLIQPYRTRSAYA